MRFSTFKKHSRGGFTLIELLLVIGIIAILASIVIVALNPTKEAVVIRDSQRRADVNTIMNAVYQYAIQNKNTFPPGITETPQEICKAEADDCTGFLDLAVLMGGYLNRMPVDPGSPSDNGTDYFIAMDAEGRVTVSAPEAEATAISVTQ